MEVLAKHYVSLTNGNKETLGSIHRLIYRFMQNNNSVVLLDLLAAYTTKTIVFSKTPIDYLASGLSFLKKVDDTYFWQCTEVRKSDLLSFESRLWPAPFACILKIVGNQCLAIISTQSSPISNSNWKN